MMTAGEKFGHILGNRSIQYQDPPFQLRAGGYSNWYVDLRAGLSDPQLLQRAARGILTVTLPHAYNVVAGIGVCGRALTMATLLTAQEFPGRGTLAFAIGNDDTRESPVDQGVANRSRYPDNRLDPKGGYGFRPARVAGKLVLAVDDTLTTGDSLETAVGMVRESGGIVETAAVVVDRSNGAASDVARRLAITLYSLFAFQEETGSLAPHFRPVAGVSQ